MARRERRGGTAALCLLVAVAAAPMLRAAPAAADPLLTCPETPVIHQVCSVATAAPNLAADGAESTFGAFLDTTTRWIVDGAKAVVGFVGKAIDNSSRPDVNADWFEPNYRLMVQVGVAFLLPLLVIAALGSLLRRDLAGLGQLVVIKLPVAAMGSAAALFVVDMLVTITDSLSGFVGATIGGSGEKFATGMVHLLEAQVLTGQAGLAGFLAFLVAFFIALLALVLWVELVVRQGAVLVATLFLPVGFAAMVWQTTAHWLRKLAEGLLAFILAKFVITAVVAVGANALAAGGDNPAALVLGAGILAVAVFTPYVLLSIIPLGTLAVVEGLSRRPVAAGSSATSTLYFGQQLIKGGGGGEAAAAPATPAAAATGGASADAGLAAGASGGAGASGAAAGGASGGAGAGVAAGAGAGASAGAGAAAVPVAMVVAGVQGARGGNEAGQAAVATAASQRAQGPGGGDDGG